MEAQKKIQLGNAATKESSPSELLNVEQKIVKQLEFYFGDSNLPFDKFLLEETKTDDGWVKISVLLTFKRLAAISTDPATIVSAIKNSYGSILEVDEASKTIRRKRHLAVPDAKTLLNKMIEHSICCKGFPITATMDDLLKFAASVGDNVITKVTPQRFKTNFTGTVYFTFSSKEEAFKFLNKRSVKYNDVELKRMWQTMYIKEKQNNNEEYVQTKKVQTSNYNKRKNSIEANNIDETVAADNV